jgi:hypothetical protein
MNKKYEKNTCEKNNKNGFFLKTATSSSLLLRGFASSMDLGNS